MPTSIPNPREVFARLPVGFTDPDHDGIDDFHRLCESPSVEVAWKQLGPGRYPWLIFALYGWWAAHRQQPSPRPAARTRKVVTRALTVLRGLNTPALPDGIRASLSGAQSVCRRWLEADDYWIDRRRRARRVRGRPHATTNPSLYACVLAECGLPLDMMADLATIFAPRVFDPTLSTATLRKRLSGRVTVNRKTPEVRRELAKFRRALRSR